MEYAYTSDVQDRNYRQILAYINRQGWDVKTFDENQSSDELWVTKVINCKSGDDEVFVRVFATGTIFVQGVSSSMRSGLDQARIPIERGEGIESLLPFEVEGFLAYLKESRKDVDEQVILFLKESIEALRTGLVIGGLLLVSSSAERLYSLLKVKFVEMYERVEKGASYEGSDKEELKVLSNYFPPKIAQSIESVFYLKSFIRSTQGIVDFENVEITKSYLLEKIELLMHSLELVYTGIKLIEGNAFRK